MKNILAGSFALLCLLLYTPVAHAQIKAHGRVRTAENQQYIPLAGATVQWLGHQLGTVTDSTGRWSLLLPEDTTGLRLLIRHVGFLPDTLYRSDWRQPIDLILTATPELAGIEIEGKRPDDYLQSGIQQVQVLTTGALQKAACCNLAESFETNAAVTTSYSDAVTGARQIEMLGLSGPYTQITVENMPGIRGLATPFGLSYIAGTWMDQVQIAKGITTVSNGYEAITGQINVELQKPEKGERSLLNLYANHIGRLEGNWNYRRPVGKSGKWSTMLLTHADQMQTSMDANGDGFMDMPMLRQFSGVNRWKYEGQHFKTQFGIKALSEEREGGQTHSRMQMVHDMGTHTGQMADRQYMISLSTRRWEAFAKTGYIFPGRQYQSIGLINTWTSHQMSGPLGLRRYEGQQWHGESNLVFQSIINTTDHSFKLGAAFRYDAYAESLNGQPWHRVERVPGVYAEATNRWGKWNIMTGIRADFHNLYGTFWTPRLHASYEPDSRMTLRLSAGKGYRVANPLVENMAALASSRQWTAGTITPEEAWNYGLNFTRYIRVDGRDLTLSADYHYVHFVRRMILDLDSSPMLAIFESRENRAYSQSLQIEAKYEPFRRVETTLSGRWNDVQQWLAGRMQFQPLVHRFVGMLNVAYTSRNGKWKWDGTAQYRGTSRLPDTSTNPENYRRPDQVPDYMLFHSQLTYKTKRADFYVGGENLGNFRIQDPIIGADEPFGRYFDPSMVWGPIFGRMVYAGVRWTL